MKKIIKTTMILIFSAALLACSGPGTDPSGDNQATETPDLQSSEPATETVSTTAGLADNGFSIADYIPLYENAVYVYEIQSEDTSFDTIEYKVKLDFVKVLEDVTAAQFTRFNDDYTLFSYVLLYEDDNIHSLRTSFESEDELTSAAIEGAKEQYACYSLMNQPVSRPHRWENWYTRPTYEGDTEQLRNWMTVSEIVNPVVPVDSLLGPMEALEVVEYQEEQTYDKCYYVPQIGLIRTDAVLDENTVTGSDVLIRIENFNHEFEGRYYETLNLHSSMLTN